MSDLGQLGLQLVGFVENVERDFRYAVEAVAVDIERESVEIIRDTIMTTQSGIVPTKPNRYWTGAMYNNAQARMSRAGNSYRIEYGWFGFGSEDYVKLQEEGGRHVEFGMHSFMAVQRKTRDILHDFQKGTYFGYF